jgi:hypothetical protein
VSSHHKTRTSTEGWLLYATGVKKNSSAANNETLKGKT